MRLSGLRLPSSIPFLRFSDRKRPPIHWGLRITLNSLFQLTSLRTRTLGPRQELEQLLPARRFLGQGKPSLRVWAGGLCPQLLNPSGAELPQETAQDTGNPWQGGRSPRAGLGRAARIPTQPSAPAITSEGLRETPVCWEQARAEGSLMK